MALCLAAALSAGAAGCDAKTLPLWSSAATHPPGPTPPSNSSDLPKPVNPLDMSFPEVKELKPSTLVAFAGLKEQAVAKTAAEAEENREEARKAYLRALELDPNYVPAHLGLARFFESQNYHKEALVHYRAALKQAPAEPRNWGEVGMCHARHKEWPAAIECLRHASQLDPDNRKLTQALGLCLARAGQPDEALLCLMKVEGEAQAHFTVARMLHHLKQDTASAKYARQALIADPRLEEARRLLAELEGGEAPANLGVSVFASEAK